MTNIVNLCWLFLSEKRGLNNMSNENNKENIEQEMQNKSWWKKLLGCVSLHPTYNLKNTVVGRLGFNPTQTNKEIKKIA